MKKLTVLLVGLFVCTSMFAQTCVEDAWQCLRQNQAPKAKKFIENCLAAYPDNAQVWLMKANVYVQLYNMDQTKKEADPSFTPRYPDALSIANEAFVKALQLDPTVKPKTGMLGAKEGQRLCAQPFYDLGVAALKAGDKQKAIDNFTIAAKNFELGQASYNAALSYYHMGSIYNEMKDVEKAEAMFTKSVNAKKDFVLSYVELYYIYSGKSDTANCAKIVDEALANVPVEAQGSLSEALMNYYSMTDQGEKLLALCDTVIAKNPDNYDMISICTNYLSNYKSFDKVLEILTPALAKEPGEFKLNEQMGYCYYEKMYALEDRVEQLKKEKKWQEVMALNNDAAYQAELKEVREKAHEWCEKAYNINSDNLDNNKHLRELKLKLGMIVPQELNDKINARMH